jgi:hypothetical protein
MDEYAAPDGGRVDLGSLLERLGVEVLGMPCIAPICALMLDIERDGAATSVLESVTAAPAGQIMT